MLPLPVADLVDRFDVGPLQVERRTPPTPNAWGGFDTAPATVLSIRPISAHNVQGRDLDQLPEADRVSEVVQFYTRTRLYTATDGFAPDVVLYQGRRWRIVTVRDFDPQGGIYCALGVLEDPQARP